MDFRNFEIINNNLYLKKYLRENSYYYKDLCRNPLFINKLNDLMRASYKLTLPDKLEKISHDINMVSSFMDIIN